MPIWLFIIIIIWLFPKQIIADNIGGEKKKKEKSLLDIVVRGIECFFFVFFFISLFVSVIVVHSRRNRG